MHKGVAQSAQPLNAQMRVGSIVTEMMRLYVGVAAQDTRLRDQFSSSNGVRSPGTDSLLRLRAIRVTRALGASLSDNLASAVFADGPPTTANIMPTPVEVRVGQNSATATALFVWFTHSHGGFLLTHHPGDFAEVSSLVHCDHRTVFGRELVDS
jgi:hypothetical protein